MATYRLHKPHLLASQQYRLSCGRQISAAGQGPSRPQSACDMHTRNGSFTALLDFNRFKRFSACSNTPAVEVSKATFELYPNSNTLTVGTRDGRKSRSQSLPSAVHVCSAWNSVFIGFRPCTATRLMQTASAKDLWTNCTRTVLDLRLRWVDYCSEEIL